MFEKNIKESPEYREYKMKKLGKDSVKTKQCDKIKRRRLMWFGHVQRMNGNRLLLYRCYIDGTRSRGRQPRIWIDNIQENLSENNLDWRTAVNLAISA